jgi:hypothetical protein
MNRITGRICPQDNSASLFYYYDEQHGHKHLTGASNFVLDVQSFRSLQGLLQDSQQITRKNLLLWLWKGMRKLPNEVWVLLNVLVVSAWLLCFLLSEDALSTLPPFPWCQPRSHSHDLISKSSSISFVCIALNWLASCYCWLCSQ